MNTGMSAVLNEAPDLNATENHSEVYSGIKKDAYRLIGSHEASLS